MELKLREMKGLDFLNVICSWEYKSIYHAYISYN